MNLKVEQQSDIAVVANFPDIVFPIMWLEEGVEELTPPIRRLIYLATTFADIAVPCLTYGMILVGLTIIIIVLVKANKNSPVLTHEAIELGKRTIRRGSSFLINGQHRLMSRDSYILLSNNDIDEKQDIIEM